MWLVYSVQVGGVYLGVMSDQARCPHHQYLSGPQPANIPHCLSGLRPASRKLELYRVDYITK